MNIKKIIAKQKYQYKIIFIFFSFHCIKMEQKIVIFGKQGIDKNSFHKDKRPINIVKVKIKRIMLSKIDP